MKKSIIIGGIAGSVLLVGGTIICAKLYKSRVEAHKDELMEGFALSHNPENMIMHVLSFFDLDDDHFDKLVESIHTYKDLYKNAKSIDMCEELLTELDMLHSQIENCNDGDMLKSIIDDFNDLSKSRREDVQ